MHALELTGLKKTYHKGPAVLHGVNLTVEEGQFFALLGPNGAGKSTTIGIITRLVNKSSGQVKIFGYDLDRQRKQAKACIGLVPQEFNFCMWNTPMDIILNAAGLYGVRRRDAKARAAKYLKKMDLWDKRNEAAMKLSGGQKRRLMIARALMHEPKLLILDEPTANVDVEIRRSMWAFLKRLNRAGVTIILTTHNLQEAEKLADHIAMIDHGKVIVDKPKRELLQMLDKQVINLDMKNSLPDAVKVKGFEVQPKGRRVLQATLEKGQTYNELFAALSAAKLEVSGFTHQQDRLEALFLQLTEVAS